MRKVYSIVSPPPQEFESGFSPSITIPDDSMSIKEIIERSMHGMLSDLSTTAPVDDEIPDDMYALGVKSSIKDLTDFDEFLFQTKQNNESVVPDVESEQIEDETNKAVTISKEGEKGRSEANDVSHDG